VLLVVVLKGSDHFCDDLRLRVTQGECHLILLNNKKDHGVEVNKTHIQSGGLIAIPTNGKRNISLCAKNCASLVKTHNLKNASHQIIDGTLLPSICTQCQIEIGKKAIGLLGEINSNGGISRGKEVGIEMVD
jgi:hypothetical protein